MHSKDTLRVENEKRRKELMSLLVVGSVALDSIETPFGKKDNVLGGSATHFSMAASFFTKVNLVAVVGKDFPKRHIQLLKSHNIDTRGLEIAKGKTFRWKGQYKYDMNTAHTIYTHLNVFKDFSPKVPETYKASKHVFLANIDPDLQKFVLKSLPTPSLVACDSMNYWIETKKQSLLKLLKKVHIAIINESEARQLSGEANLVKAAKFITAHGPRVAIIKKGEHGVLLFSNDCFFSAPGYPLETIYDPTGAGDCFAGGFMGYLNQFNSLDDGKIRKAVIYGSIIASFNVENFGPNRLLKLTKREITSRYKEFQRLTKF